MILMMVLARFSTGCPSFFASTLSFMGQCSPDRLAGANRLHLSAFCQEKTTVYGVGLPRKCLILKWRTHQELKRMRRILGVLGR